MSYTHYPWSITGLGPGDHLCCIYETEAEHRAVLTPFLRRGLLMGERVLYVTAAHETKDILGHLEAAGIDVQYYQHKRQLVFRDSESVYLDDQGHFDPQRMLKIVQRELKDALDAGLSGLCATGEMHWAARRPDVWETLLEYEMQLNDVLAGTRALALCQYSREQFDYQVLLAILRSHPVVIIGSVGYDKYAPLAGLPPARATAA